MTQRQKWLVACLTVKQHKDGSSPRVFCFFLLEPQFDPQLWPLPLLQVFVNGEAYDVGTVAYHNNTTVIVGIVLGIIAALVLGAGLALVAMFQLKKKKTGEYWKIQHWLRWRELVLRCSGLCGRLITARSDCVPTAIIENRLSTLLSRSRMSSARELSPTGDYRRGMTPEGGKCLNWTVRIRY